MGEVVNVPQELLDLKVNLGLLHEAVRIHRANSHTGNHDTLTRGEVRGGGRKPWKQKHTGRARAGSNRSPLWRKGGVIFGPKPRDYSLDFPKRKRSMAFLHAIASRFPDRICFMQEENFSGIEKTKQFAQLLAPVYEKGSLLVVVAMATPELRRVSANLSYVRLVPIMDLNTYDVVGAKSCIFTEKAWSKYLEARYK